ncbi:FtsK/SpoIIIE domain-containing protein [Pseudofrankia sp. BMG5.37]|uniref:FtsK/SpoIIIE domain-containing protein n=1 Tax=Pseudofrankia sp. BMG5.37 TaxID=3050035 RepID=UPI0028942CAE|nr:FtsK/SpoIIIE domain-containing protein [Pseudofrankia sp. BMG5.37]MDT3445981.1 FtsK/SpoIIIE domain-containing protein [Pseudofrankia sp. BMG5.37]
MTTTDPFDPGASPEPDGWTPDLEPLDVFPTETTEPSADVVDLGAARARRPIPAQRSAPDEAGDEGDDTDRESVAVEPAALGAPVDPPDETGAPAGVTRPVRAPMVPGWLRSRATIRAAVRQTSRHAGYVAGFHALRAPKYLVLAMFWATVGLFRLVGRLLRWATAEEGNWALRQDAARRNDAPAWLQLDRARQRQSTTRWPILIVGAVLVLVAYAVLWFGPWPSLLRLAVMVATVVGLARFGRPADRPIVDRVSKGAAYRKLTAELVRRALTSIGLAGINSAVAKDPGAISFPMEIHRDGPGHLAVVDLPYGVEAAEVVARRGRLASGLRLPLDQVWPEPASGHTGRLALWVGHEPASKMRQPAWPLIRSGKVDVFEPFAFATTPRMTTVCVSLMFRNWLFGGQPGSGKTFALRLLVLAAALDPRVEIRGYELKGVGDFADLEPVLTEYGNGFDDDTIERAAGMVDWVYAECQRRSERIDYYRARGMAPEGKVTPKLASLKGSGLHPLVVFIDEAQELFTSRWGKAAGETLERAIKLGRALGVVILLGTQIPDKDSLPTGITRNVNSRFCLSVADQTANDMILGTSAYKNGYRATVFEPVTEAGWGILVGFGKPGADRSFYVAGPDLARVVARAVELRTGAGTLPTPTERTRAAEVLDVLADVAAVWPLGEDKVWNETLCVRLAEHRPDAYAGWKPAQLTAALSPHQISVGQIWGTDPTTGKGGNRRGVVHADILNAITERDRKRNG